jgi:hypothetical protein
MKRCAFPIRKLLVVLVVLVVLLPLRRQAIVELAGGCTWQHSVTGA